jgi:ABC-type iron transport system FetAB ATPase subunit
VWAERVDTSTGSTHLMLTILASVANEGEQIMLRGTGGCSRSRLPRQLSAVQSQQRGAKSGDCSKLAVEGVSKAEVFKRLCISRQSVNRALGGEAA